MGICDGRVVIVTGSGRGIGREHALAYAAEGAKVVVNDLGGDMHGDGGSLSPAMEVVEEIKGMGGEAVADGENVADFAGAGRMVQRAIDTFGRLDTVVNNAGILRDRMLTNMEESEWDAVIAVHLKGAFAPTRHAAAYWREQSKAGNPVQGRIVKDQPELQHPHELGPRLLASVDRAPVERSLGPRCFAERAMKLILEDPGDEIARVGDVRGDVIFGAGVEIFARNSVNRRHRSLILEI